MEIFQYSKAEVMNMDRFTKLIITDARSRLRYDLQTMRYLDNNVGRRTKSVKAGTAGSNYLLKYAKEATRK